MWSTQPAQQPPQQPPQQGPPRPSSPFMSSLNLFSSQQTPGANIPHHGMYVAPKPGAATPLMGGAGPGSAAGMMGMPGGQQDISGEQLMQVSVIAWVIFTVICLLFGLSYHESEDAIWTVLFLGAAFLVTVMYQSWKRWDSSLGRASFIVSSWFLFALVMGTWVGLFAYHCCIEEYWMSEKLESRTNVLPGEPAGAYANAGNIIFADEARVDPSKSAGLKDGNTFCVAPVASDSPMDAVQFWAAGVGCCESRGGFVCDDAWNSKAHAGVVIRNGSFSIVHNDIYGQYMKAVKLAETTYSIASAQAPIFIRWVENPVEVELNSWRAGLGVLLACIIIAALLCGLQGCGLHVVLNKDASQLARYAY